MRHSAAARSACLPSETCSSAVPAATISVCGSWRRATNLRWDDQDWTRTRNATADVSLCGEILFAHLFQCRADQLAIGLEQPVRHLRRLGCEALFSILDHPRVLQRVSLGNAIGNTPAIDDGFSVESKQGDA